MAGTTPAVNDLLQCRVVCYTDTQISMNVLHYEVAATAGIPLTLSQISNLFSARVQNAYKNLMPPTASYRGCDFRNLMPPATLPFPETVDDGVGLTGTTLTPTQVSMLIRTQANFAGRGYIGHVYPGLISATYVDVDGALTGAGSAALTILANLLGPSFALVGDTGQASLALTIRHPNTLGPVIVPVWTRVLTVLPSGLLATQRRRGEFGARNIPPF